MRFEVKKMRILCLYGQNGRYDSVRGIWRASLECVKTVEHYQGKLEQMVLDMQSGEDVQKYHKINEGKTKEIKRKEGRAQ